MIHNRLLDKLTGSKWSLCFPSHQTTAIKRLYLLHVMQPFICLAQPIIINLKLALADHINYCEIHVACTTCRKWEMHITHLLQNLNWGYHLVGINGNLILKQMF